MTNTIQLIAALTATAVIGGAAAVGSPDPAPVEAVAGGAVTAEADVAADARSEPSGIEATVETGVDARADLAGHVAANVGDTPAADIATNAVAHASAVTEAALGAGNNGEDEASDTEKAAVVAVASSKGETAANAKGETAGVGTANLNAEFGLDTDTDVTVEAPVDAVASVEGSATMSSEIGLNG
ncbi:MAG: hypothetical protein WD990_06470 [Acidimicrobiia bacterium]